MPALGTAIIVAAAILQWSGPFVLQTLQRLARTMPDVADGHYLRLIIDAIEDLVDVRFVAIE